MTTILSTKYTMVAILSTFFCDMAAICFHNSSWSLFCPCSFSTMPFCPCPFFRTVGTIFQRSFCSMTAVLSSKFTMVAILSTILLNHGRHFVHDPFVPWPPFCPRMTIPSPFPPGNMPDVKACLFAHANECIIPASQFYRGGICQELDEYSERGVLFSFL